MADAVERLVNLALLLAGSPRPLRAAEVRAEDIGYPEGQDDAAFARMFERDKKDLRAAGLVIAVSGEPGEESYSIDAEETYAPAVELSAEESATLHAAAAALACDPSFPFGEDLRLALAKVLADIGAPAPALPGAIADESPGDQGELAAALSAASAGRKTAAFGYVTADGREGDRRVAPYGLFLREGRWYLVAMDQDRGAVRVFALSRMSRLAVNREKPETADFERPADFDVSAYLKLPFQYGGRSFSALVSFAPAHAWRAPRLSAGQGALQPLADGSVLWRVPAADPEALMRWVVENGPGLALIEPAGLAERMLDLLRGVEAAHG